MTFSVDQEIQFDAETWKIIGVGTQDGNHTYLHLASTTRGRQQRNGWVPAMIATWVRDPDAPASPDCTNHPFD